MNRIVRKMMKENNQLSELLSPENQALETDIVVYLRGWPMGSERSPRAPFIPFFCVWRKTDGCNRFIVLPNWGQNGSITPFHHKVNRSTVSL